MRPKRQDSKRKKRREIGCLRVAVVSWVRSGQARRSAPTAVESQTTKTHATRFDTILRQVFNHSDSENEGNYRLRDGLLEAPVFIAKLGRQQFLFASQF